jgi:hypothetical protein
MRTATATLATVLLLSGCTGAVSGTYENQAAYTCDYDGAGGGCPQPPRPPLPVDTPIKMRCPDGPDSVIPAPREQRFVNLSTVWGTAHGVLVPYYTVDTAGGDQSRVQVFGVDLDTRQVVFSLFTSSIQAPPGFTLQNLTHSDPQHPNCPGDHLIDQGTASAGKAPGDPPPSSGGPICPDGPCFCTIDFILSDAASRGCL